MEFFSGSGYWDLVLSPVIKRSVQSVMFGLSLAWCADAMAGRGVSASRNPCHALRVGNRVFVLSVVASAYMDRDTYPTCFKICGPPLLISNDAWWASVEVLAAVVNRAFVDRQRSRAQGHSRSCGRRDLVEAESTR